VPARNWCTRALAWQPSALGLERCAQGKLEETDDDADFLSQLERCLRIER
jgi:hypothetical protein